MIRGILLQCTVNSISSFDKPSMFFQRYLFGHIKHIVVVWLCTIAIDEYTLYTCFAKRPVVAILGLVSKVDFGDITLLTIYLIHIRYSGVLLYAFTMVMPFCCIARHIQIHEETIFLSGNNGYFV